MLWTLLLGTAFACSGLSENECLQGATNGACACECACACACACARMCTRVPLSTGSPLLCVLLFCRSHSFVRALTPRRCHALVLLARFDSTRDAQTLLDKQTVQRSHAVCLFRIRRPLVVLVVVQNVACGAPTRTATARCVVK